MELIILEKVGTADLVYRFVELKGSCTLGFDLVFGLESGRFWKNFLCIGLLNVSFANLIVRLSLLSVREGRSQASRASSYGTG